MRIDWDRLRANRVESSGILDESTQFDATFKERGRFIFIIASDDLTSGDADRLRANRVESSCTLDESTKFGCIGQGWKLGQVTKGFDVSLTKNRDKQ